MVKHSVQPLKNEGGQESDDQEMAAIINILTMVKLKLIGIKENFHIVLYMVKRTYADHGL